MKKVLIKRKRDFDLLTQIMSVEVFFNKFAISNKLTNQLLTEEIAKSLVVNS